MAQKRSAEQVKQRGLVGDLWLLVKRERKWWLIPLLIVLFGVVALMLLAGSAGPLAPFLYPLL
ncbi:MAG TPA: DUF5989 family protein [Burkholderiales bacterium]|nr:DUF5989 family protein [Burkholderiales bacterium]